MENKEKPLKKMTAKELREIALGIEGIQGVHAMKKDELIAAIRKAKGLADEEPKKVKPAAHKKEEKVTLTKAELKQKIKEMKTKKAEALQQNNWRMAQILRKRISRYKKRTRRATV
jgi:hypothetical protein